MKRSLKPAPHTPGPWRVYQEKPHYYSVGTDYAHDRGHDSNIVRDVRCEANARIMASAPELLEALEALVKLTQHGPEAFDGEPLEAIASAREAIAKAKGVGR